MPIENSLKEIEKKLTPLFNSSYKFILLFGSAVTESLTSESDIDVGLYTDKEKPSFEEKSKIIAIFQKTLERNCDLIFLNDADIIIINQILTTGKVIWNSEPDFFLEFQVRKMSEYIDFKMSRKIIEQSLDKTGWPKWQKKT